MSGWSRNFDSHVFITEYPWHVTFILLQIHMRTEAVMLLATVALSAIPHETTTLANLALALSRPGAFNKVHGDSLNNLALYCKLV